MALHSSAGTGERTLSSADTIRRVANASGDETEGLTEEEEGSAEEAEEADEAEEEEGSAEEAEEAEEGINGVMEGVDGAEEREDDNADDNAEISDSVVADDTEGSIE